MIGASKNNMRALVLHYGVVVALILVLFSQTINAYAKEPVTQPDYLMLLSYINEARINEGLEPMQLQHQLQKAAMIRAQECDVIYSHTRPDGTDWYTVNDAIYGETLAQALTDEQKTADKIFKAWMNSPSHKAVLLEPSLISVGFGEYVTEDGTTYIAAEFGIQIQKK